MPSFSKKSRDRLATCHYLLQELMNSVIKETDITVLCGFRDKAEQERAFAEGKSKARWGESKHNSYPSMAVDIAPYPIDWNDITRFEELGAVVMRHWEEMPLAKRGGWELRWGKSFKGLVDYPHWELRSV
jgi:peptidoglycan L-alanyl-D-glutamate endopeptidase CwlK